MNVVGHNDITADGDVEVTMGTLGISEKRRVNFIAREIWLPQVSAKGDKIERARVKETAETRRAAVRNSASRETFVATPLRVVQTDYDVFRPFINRPQAGGYIREIASEID